jgi:hypothetical protein
MSNTVPSKKKKIDSAQLAKLKVQKPLRLNVEDVYPFEISNIESISP